MGPSKADKDILALGFRLRLDVCPMPLYGDFSVKRKTIYAAPFLILSVLAACG